MSSVDTDEKIREWACDIDAASNWLKRHDQPKVADDLDTIIEEMEETLSNG